jgi:hypothetical protein
VSSGCPCYVCDGLGTVADGLDERQDPRDRACSHCGGSGQEPESEVTEPLPATEPRGPSRASILGAARIIEDTLGHLEAQRYVDRYLPECSDACTDA